MAQIHTRFTDEQIKDMLKRYLNGEIASRHRCARQHLHAFGAARSVLSQLVIRIYWNCSAAENIHGSENLCN